MDQVDLSLMEVELGGGGESCLGRGERVLLLKGEKEGLCELWCGNHRS